MKVMFRIIKMVVIRNRGEFEEEYLGNCFRWMVFNWGNFVFEGIFGNIWR